MPCPTPGSQSDGIAGMQSRPGLLWKSIKSTRSSVEENSVLLAYLPGSAE